MIAALAYFTPVFAFAFGLGALRETAFAPVTGAFLAVALETPVVLAMAWRVASRVLGRWPLPARSRIAMGTLAFAILILAELATALAFVQSPGQFLAAIATGPGAIGLAGQIAIGLIPALRPYPRG